MYEEELKKLASPFKSKRKEAIETLSEEMKSKPHELMKELLKASRKVWENSFDIFKDNPKIAYRTALELYPIERSRVKELIIYLGRGHVLKKLDRFHSLKKELDSYIVEGIGVHYQDAYSNFLSGKMDIAIKRMERLALKGKRLREMKRKWRKLRIELRKMGKDISDIEPYMANADIEGAEEIIKEMEDMLSEENSEAQDEGKSEGGESDVRNPHP